MLLVKVLALRVIMYQKVILGVVIDFSFLEVSMETFFSKAHFFRMCQNFDEILSQKCVLSSISEAVKNFSYYFPTLKMMIMVSAVLFN